MGFRPADASPLIYLGRTGYPDLLQRTAGIVCVPEAVVREIHDDESGPAARACDWLRTVRVDALPRAVGVWSLDGRLAEPSAEE